MSNCIKRDIKICGIRSCKTIETCLALGVTHIGLITHPESPRFLTPEDVQILMESLSNNNLIKVVLVTVNLPLEQVKTYLVAAKGRITHIQLHGSENIKYIQHLKTFFDGGVIKAVSIENKEDFSVCTIYQKSVSNFLFDCKPTLSDIIPGGNARSFDWNLMKYYTLKIPWFLAGGLNITNIAQAISVTNAPGLDISSGVESRPGVKSDKMIRELVNKVREYDSHPAI